MSLQTTGSALIADLFIFFFQAEDGIRDLVRSRGLGDVYKRQVLSYLDKNGVLIKNKFGNLFSFKTDFMISDEMMSKFIDYATSKEVTFNEEEYRKDKDYICLLYTSDAADERSSVDLGGRRIIKKKKNKNKLRRETEHRQIHRRECTQ